MHLWCSLVWMAQRLWNTQGHSTVSVKTGKGLILWICLCCCCYCLCDSRKDHSTAQHSTDPMCQWETGHGKVIFQLGQMCISWEEQSFYAVIVDCICSLPIHLIVTKACRLVGLPAATYYEELDPACVRVGMRLHACECVLARVCVWV